MGRRRKRRKRRPRGFSDRPWKWPYDLFFRATGIHGREKREVLNYFAWCISVSVAVGAGLAGGIIVGEFLGLGFVGGVPAGLIAACVAFGKTAEFMMRNRFYRP